MSFADIINQEQKKLEAQSGGGDKVEYPKVKHKRLFCSKETPELLIQVLPSRDLYSAFSVPVRKIFLRARSSNGKDINSNFILDAEPNPGSILEQKIAEWSDKGMIPNGFGGQQTPKRVYLVNAVKIVQVNGQWTQERDEQGNLVVRVFDMPQSAYQNLLRKLKDPMINVTQSEMSFMDINRPFPIKISRPAKGQMEYPVEVYPSIALPPLGQGWENQLEDLEAEAVPTERLVNGLQWVQAFIDMKEGRKPSRSNENNQTQAQGQTTAAPTNPFADVNANSNPYATVVGTVPNNPYTQQPNPYAVAQPPAQANTYQPAVPSPAPIPASAPAPATVPTPVPAAPSFDANIGLNVDPLPESMLQPQPGQSAAPNVPPATVAAPTPSQVPEAPAPASAPEAPEVPAHATNSNGLNDIDALLASELGNL